MFFVFFCYFSIKLFFKPESEEPYFFKEENIIRYIRHKKPSKNKRLNRTPTFPDYYPISKGTRTKVDVEKPQEERFIRVVDGFYEMKEKILNQEVKFKIPFNLDPSIRKQDHKKYDLERK